MRFFDGTLFRFREELGRGLSCYVSPFVGLGPWGLCALERVVTLARQELPRGIDVAVTWSSWERLAQVSTT